jgi:rRNA maturation endonuclease Nob1
VLVCDACRRENADDARFCSGCGAPLAAVAVRPEGRKGNVVRAEKVRSLLVEHAPA